MEELYVWALLWLAEFPVERDYQTSLETQFFQNEADDDLRYLIYETNLKQATLYICAHFPFKIKDRDLFTKTLLQQLHRFFDTQDLHTFTDALYTIWNLLPPTFAQEDPFRILSYAGDPLTWGDIPLCRSFCERMFRHINKS